MTEGQFAELLALAQTLATLDKRPGISNGNDAYAYALGRANGIGKIILQRLEQIKPRRVRILATDDRLAVTVGRTFIMRADTPALFTGSELSEIFDELDIDHTYIYRQNQPATPKEL